MFLIPRVKENFSILHTVKENIFTAWEVAKDNLIETQQKMTEVLDRKAKARTFKEEGQVLALLSMTGNQLQAEYAGLYVVCRELSNIIYIINMPNMKRK